MISNPTVCYAKCAEAAVKAGVKISQLRMKAAHPAVAIGGVNMGLLPSVISAGARKRTAQGQKGIRFLHLLRC